MPTIFSSVIIFFSPSLLAVWNLQGKYMLIGIVFLFTFLFPLLSTFLLFFSQDQKQHLDFFSMENSRDRVKPFLLVGFIYLLFAYMLYHQLRLNNLVIVVLFCVAIAVILSGIISYFWKISIHAVGISGLLGFFVVLNEWSTDGALFYIVIAFILISGGVMSARLYLNQHTPSQVFTGFLLGLSISVAGLLYFR